MNTAAYANRATSLDCCSNEEEIKTVESASTKSKLNIFTCLRDASLALGSARCLRRVG